ncbi:hypothetical protein BCT76_16325 [Vibrio tasmaniensis]|uniref:adenylate/guanylate cyclase n=1 Tax=Vibrio tasmaniensis TaxID=212663 RepID=UPI000C84C528|nr:adenylate/guanylate cyclase [Vibrio tasmaniensis]PML45822.1 hypothetical protein BCT76_16325 [Vibrio tasmaniensis]
MARLSSTDKSLLSEIISKSLDRAEAIWNTEGADLIFESVSLEDSSQRGMDSIDLIKKSELVPSRIPGTPVVSSDENKVEEFIALVADMRDSTKHLMTRNTHGSVSELQRVYYETSALLPALDFTISKSDGSVTEYLGDGVLALFKVDSDDVGTSTRNAKWAATDCLEVVLPMVNDELFKRYELPDLQIGIGLAFSKALVTTMGLPGRLHAKAFGKCIYRATKLSNGANQILVDDQLKAKWPVNRNGGGFTFKRLKSANLGFDAYEMPY